MKKQGTTSSVTVAIRVRPLSEREKQIPEQAFALDIGDKHISLPNDSTHVFDAVFGPEHSTQDVYDAIAEPIVSSSLAGVNGTIFAYGQTASGKTFSMQGAENHPGLLRLAARQLFDVAKNADWSYTFVVSYIEIYNERVKDLFNAATTKSAQDAASDLKIREDRLTGFYVDGVTERRVDTYEELLELFEEGEKRRHVAGTDMNLKSSRSHTVFTINVMAKQRPNESGDFAFGTLKSRLSLVDLAGSESARLTNAEGERLKEGAQINKSLLSLSLVISTLAKAGGKDAHVKFRDSKLTQILQPSLAGNCRTAVLCCVTPAATYLSETSSTLKFASSAKHIQTSYVVNQIADNSRNMKSYQDQVEALTRALHEERNARAIAESNVSLRGAERVAELEAKLEEMEAILDNAAKERDNLRDRMNAGLAENKKLAVALEEASVALEQAKLNSESELAAALEEAKAREADLHANISAQIEKERAEWRKALETVESEKARLSESLGMEMNQWQAQAKADAEKRDLEAKEREEALIEQFNNEKSGLIREHEEVRSSLESQLGTVSDQLQTITSEKAQLGVDLQSAMARIEALEIALKDSEQRQVELREQLGKDAASALEQLELDFRAKLEVANQEHAQKLAALIEEKDEVERSLRADGERLTRRLKEANAEIDNEKAMRHRVEGQLADSLAAKRQAQDELAAERRRAVEMEAELQDQIRAAQRDKAAVERKLEAERLTQKAADDIVSNEHNKLNHELRRQEARARELEIELTEEHTRLMIASEQVSNLSSELARIKEAYNNEIESLQAQNQDSESVRISKLNQDLAKKRRELQDVNERLSDLRKLHEEEIRNRDAEMEALRAKLDDAHVSHLNEQVLMKERELKDALDRAHSFERTCLASQEELRTMKHAHEEACKRFEAQIAELKKERDYYEQRKLTQEWMDKFQQTKDENKRLKAENSALKADADKYHGMRQRLDRQLAEGVENLPPGSASARRAN